MKVSFIGGGNMATALITGMLERGLRAEDIRVAEVVPAARDRLAAELGVRCSGDLGEALPGAEVVVLAVKPQQLAEVCRAAAPYIGDALVLSIAAGIRLDDIGRWLGGHPRMVRCMPNTPALIGLGVTAAFASPAGTATDLEAASRILGAVGKLVWVDKEALLDPVTAISGSGPAYVFYFIEAMQEAADQLGLPADVARTLVMETFRGATELALRASEPPATLRARVTSKGGTTAAALASMDSDQVKTAIGRAIHAANRRAGELADELGKH